jgi:hypothetical protein
MFFRARAHARTTAPLDPDGNTPAGCYTTRWTFAENADIAAGNVAASLRSEYAHIWSVFDVTIESVTRVSWFEYIAKRNLGGASWYARLDED